MFTNKNHYYLYIENTKILNLSLIKIRNKFTIIYRNNLNLEKLDLIKMFRKNCKRKGINFCVANNIELAIKCRADGVYLSANNKALTSKLKNNINKLNQLVNNQELNVYIKKVIEYSFDSN